MPIATRDILATWYRPDGTLAIDEPIQYRLIPGSYAAGGMVPTGIVEDITNDVGQTNTALWVNGDGLTPTRWIVTNPSGEEYRFVVPPGDGALLLEELLEQEAHYPWRDFWSEEQADLIEASIMAKLADTVDPALGDALVGMRHAGAGAVGRTVHDKLAETVSVLDFGADNTGVSDCRVAFQAAIDAVGLDPRYQTLIIPGGQYLFNSLTGVAPFARTLLLENLHGIRIVGQPGAELQVDWGANGRFLVIRDCTDIVMEGFTIRDITVDDPETEEREDRTAGVALNIENSSRITVRDMLLDDFGSYGIGITEATNTPAAAGSTISYALHTITGPAGMFSAFVAPCEILVLNSAYNDARLHCTAVAPDGSTLTVTETLVTEAAGVSTDVLTNNTFSMTGNALSVVTADLSFLDVDSRFTLAGTKNGGANDGTYTASYVDEIEGKSLNITGLFEDESQGNNITLTRLGRSNISVLDAKACDDILIENCVVRNMGRHGIEDFPKALSRNHNFLNNTIEYCGHFITSGSAMKPGQSTINTLVEGNLVRGCNMGINPGAYAGIMVRGNTVINCHKYGIAFGISTHVRGVPAYDAVFMMQVYDNLIAYTTDETTGRLFETPSPGYGAMNINGLMETIGLIDIAGNTIFRWGHSAGGFGVSGIEFNKSYVPMPNIKIRNNRLSDSGGVRTVTISYTCTMNGTTTLSNFVNFQTNPDSTGPAGIYETMQLVGPHIPETARVVSVNLASGTVVLSQATLDGPGPFTAVPVRSARPYGVVVDGNIFESTSTLGSGVVQLSSDAGVIRRNVIRGFAPANSIQALGSTMTIDANEIIEPNRKNDAAMPAIVVGATNDTGAYIVTNNKIDLGLNGHALYMVAALHVGSWYTLGNWSPQKTIVQYDSGSIVPLPAFWWEGTRLITVGTRAPIAGEAPSGPTGNWVSGYEIRNLVPNRFSAIRGWLCVTTGNPGTWVSLGAVGQGNNLQRPVGGTGPGQLTVSDKLFYQNSDTNALEYWSGSAWKTVCSLL